MTELLEERSLLPQHKTDDALKSSSLKAFS
jgi:hypothetical protein